MPMLPSPSRRRPPRLRPPMATAGCPLLDTLLDTGRRHVSPALGTGGVAVAARPRPSPIGAFLSRAWPPLAKLSARRAGNPAHRGADIVWVFWQTRAAVVRPINPRPAQSPIRPCGSALRSQQRARQHRPAGLQVKPASVRTRTLPAPTPSPAVAIAVAIGGSVVAAVDGGCDVY